MNEKIRELAEQCEISRLEYNSATMMTERIQEFDKAKFAELIVKECAKRVDYWESRQGEHTEDLLKHFGVE